MCCLVVAGCTHQTSDELELPDFFGKADVSDQVNLRGPIAYGGTVEGEFVDDLQYDAFTFSARAGAVVRAETTHRGSASRLDDVLMVYGPGTERGGYAGATRVGSDDNSGWGDHARIEELVLPAEGNYLLVVGTKDGQGRGAYRLALQCPTGDCEPSAGDLTACDGSIVGYADLCIDARMGDEGESLERAFDNCADEDTLEEQMVDACEYSATPPAYCAAGMDRLRDEMVPACRNTIGFEFGLVSGPQDTNSGPVFGDWAEALDLAAMRDLGSQGFDGQNGIRTIRRSALRAPDSDRLYARFDAMALAEHNPDWLEVLQVHDEWDDFTEWVELEWELYEVFELWADGAVVGYVGHNEASVSYWDDSDPDDPVSADFDAFVFVTSGEYLVREAYDGP